MALKILDPIQFMNDGIFGEDHFLEQIDAHDWEQFRGKSVLVRGCNSLIVPPWAFMIITGRLSGLARSVRFGNEHDNILVLRNEAKKQ